MVERVPEFLDWVKTAGARFLSPANSEFLILMLRDLEEPFAEKVGRDLEAFASLAMEDCVALLNQQYKVEACVNLDLMAFAPIRDFTVIRAIVFMPHVGRRLGNWSRRQRLGNKLYSVSFDDPSENIQSLGPNWRRFEEQILRPWLSTRAPIQVSSVEFFLTHAAHHRTVTRTLRQLCALSAARYHRVHLAVAHNDDDDLLSELLSSFQRIDSIQKDIDELVDPLIRDVCSLPKHSSSALPRVDSVIVDRLQSATEEIKHISKELPTEKDVSLGNVSIQSGGSGLRDKSPVDNAIAIREKLLASVDFVDSAKWGKWRGVKSNPSATLGKYKTQGRIFAVRSSKQDLYPRFQFEQNAKPLPVIEQVLKVVPKDAQGWSLLSWFEAKNALLKGRKPVDMLGRDPAAVVTAAAQFYSRED